MAIHFERDEFEARKAAVLEEMTARRFDALLLFAPESHYWLTGYDTFGFCFFQAMLLDRKGEFTLLTRLPDLRQARHTSIVEDVRVWADRGGADPVGPLKEMLFERDLLGARIGIEMDTHGLTAKNYAALEASLRSFAQLHDASDVVPYLRAVKSPAEIAYVREAARLTEAAFAAGRALIAPGEDEGRILAAMQGTVFEGGGDYPGNEFIIGSGRDALLCRYKSGRRRLEAEDQITLEFAGAYRRYHVAMMQTVVVGRPTPRHEELFAAASTARAAGEGVMRPGHTIGDVFDAHARVIDEAGLHATRMNACGYSLGARYTPSWMEWPMFYRDNPAEIVPNMVLFAHMILFDSASGTAMTLGRTYLTTAGDPEPLLPNMPRELVAC